MTREERAALARENGKKGGRPKGSKNPLGWEASALARREVRTHGLKHGKFAKVLTPEEIKEGLLRQIHPQAPELFRTVFKAAATGGDLDEYSQLSAEGMVQTALLRGHAIEKIVEDGIVVEERGYDAQGQTKVIRRKAHPLLERVIQMSEQLGFTAEQMQMTRKSRGEGEKNAAVTAMLTRRTLLRSADKGRMLPPAPAIETTVVK